jgi:two-component sensor histidine kinase
MKFHLKKYIRKTPYQVIVVTILFIVFYFSFVPRYTSHVKDHFNTFKSIYYKDLNGDGTSEMIEYFGYPLSSEYDRATIIVKDLHNVFLGTWNHKGRHLRISTPVFSDYNHDGITEIFTFHRQKDSIFINGINPDSSDVFFVQSRFIDTTRWVNNTVHLKVHGFGSIDYNKDNYEDIVFHIDAGFSLQPRNTYIYDIKNDSVLKSPTSYANLASPFGQIFDINNDGEDEILLNTHASENIKDFDLPFHDYSSYVMVLSNQLLFVKKPYEIKGSMSTTKTQPIVTKNARHIFVQYHNFGDRATDSLFLFTHNVKLETKKCLDSILKQYESTVNLRFHLEKGDYNYLKIPTIGLKNGIILQFDSLLNISNQIRTNIDPLVHAIPLELDGDSTQWEYLVSDNNKAYFTDHNFKAIASPEFEINTIRNFGRIKKDTHQNHFYLQDKENVFHFVFELNPWFIYSWITVIIVFILLWLMIMAIKGIISILRKYQMIDILRERDSHKTHLARELHDELGSKITGLRLMLENLDSMEAANEIQKLSAHLQKTHEEVRNIIYNLAPPNLKNKSFGQTIEQLIHTFDSISEISFHLEFLPGKQIVDQLDDEIKTELFRILQESLNNIIKHANANTVIVQFMQQEHYLEIFVEDDGVGFDSDNTQSGQGLISMETRAKMIKGYMSLYSEKGKGTSIAIQVPIKVKKKKNRNVLFNFIIRRSPNHH